MASQSQNTLGLTKHRHGSEENGYVLFSPMGSKTTYLIDKCGRNVHSWSSKYSPALSVYLLPDGNLLRTGIANDTFYIQPGKGGIIEKLDWNGNVLWSYNLSNDSLCQHHDICPMPNGNILVIAWHGIPSSEAFARGRLTGTIGGPKLWCERILELEPVGTSEARVVWQWSLVDHLVQDASISKPEFNTISSHPELMNINYVPLVSPDWIHMNSIDYNPDLDQIMVSCHNNSEIWIIDHSTTIAEAAGHSGGKYGKGGDLLYRWGNPAAYNKGSKATQKLFKQHNANWIPKGYKDGSDIMIFNNGLGRTPAYSSVEIISPPTTQKGVYNQTLPFGPSAQKWIYKDSTPVNFYSAVISGAHRMRNGNTMICSGTPGKFFEVNGQNTVVWEYINPVAQGDNIMSDGQDPLGNSVFRCTWYSDSVSAFKGKDLSPGSPIEKSPVKYFCSLEVPDLDPPKPKILFPATLSLNITSNVLPEVTFDEPVFIGSSGMIRIFENGILNEELSVFDKRVSINGNLVSVLPSEPFSPGSIINIGWDAEVFRDLAGNYVMPMDTSRWQFTIAKETGSFSDIVSAGRKSFYPNPANDLLFIPVRDALQSITLTNTVGQSIQLNVSLNIRSEAMADLSPVSPGLYTVRAGNAILGKLVKM